MAETIEIDINAKDNTSAAANSARVNFQRLGREITGIGRSMTNIFTRPIMDLERFIMKNEEVQKAMKPINEAFTKVGDKLATSFVPIIERLTPTLLSLADSLSKIIDWFSKLPPGVQDSVLAFTGIVAAIGPALVIIGQLVTAFGVVSTFFTTGAGAGFGAAVVGVFGAITAPVWLLIGAIVLLGATIAIFGKQAWQTVTDIGKIFQALWTLIQIKIDQIKQAFLSVDWGGIGRNIMEGIRNGIHQGISWIVNAARSAAQAAVDAARNLLGLHSPSLVFAGIGQNMMKGMANGINSNAKLPIAATSNVVSGTIPAATSTSNNNSTSVPFVYSPMISLASQAEAESVLLPMLRKLQRSM
jgi:hypothetical protein